MTVSHSLFLRRNILYADLYVMMKQKNGQTMAKKNLIWIIRSTHCLSSDAKLHILNYGRRMASTHVSIAALQNVHANLFKYSKSLIKSFHPSKNNK